MGALVHADLIRKAPGRMALDVTIAHQSLNCVLTVWVAASRVVTAGGKGARGSLKTIRTSEPVLAGSILGTISTSCEMASIPPIPLSPLANNPQRGRSPKAGDRSKFLNLGN